MTRHNIIRLAVPARDLAKALQRDPVVVWLDVAVRHDPVGPAIPSEIKLAITSGSKPSPEAMAWLRKRAAMGARQCGWQAQRALERLEDK